MTLINRISDLLHLHAILFPAFILLSQRGSLKLTLTTARSGVDDGRMRPSRTNSTEGPIDAFD
jgi:hypothetical protein